MKTAQPVYPGAVFPNCVADRQAYGLAAGLLAAGFRTGFFGVPFSLGMASSVTLALSQCKQNVGSGSQDVRVPVKWNAPSFSTRTPAGSPTPFASMSRVLAPTPSASPAPKASLS